ncbi:MAG TPA: PepSY-associated TM helix domain-containing protein [Saprospiraceae bacterium]|nr:PepSY-associated TM helix domain-containing protein [Saprospiraceae bacterium]HMU02327.1 PepSY-associated TM helix domain-containing protein [Saprospiraceae bacterium]
MDIQHRRQQQAKTIRRFRKVHRVSGIFLFVFLFLVGLSGILLGWKKNSGGIILSKTEMGISINPKDWLTLDSLYRKASLYMQDSMAEKLDPTIDRLDIRPEKGIVKFTFKEHYYGLQIDATSGNVLKVERRNADIIEQIHDGSIVDRYLGIKNGWFKLIYTTVMGLGLITFTVTGFWLWYGPKRMKTN